MLQQIAKGKNDVSVTEIKQEFLRLFSFISIQMGQQAVFARRAFYPEYFPPF